MTDAPDITSGAKDLGPLAKVPGSGSPRPQPRLGNEPDKPRRDAALRSLGRLLLGSFYRQIEIVGTDHFPQTGPVIVVANHGNSLVDGGLISTFLPRMPRLLAASSVWDYRPLRPLLNAAKVVPLARRQDGNGDPEALLSAFQAASDVLLSGGVLALFPEGTSHNEPKVLPLKTGAARIALDTEARNGSLGVRIVPVCLTFEAKNKFRSRALVEIAPALDIAPDRIAAYCSADRAARSRQVRHLTQEIKEAMEALSPPHKTWDEARLIGRAADILAASEGMGAPPPTLAEATSHRRALHLGHAVLRTLRPEQTEALRRDLIDYDRMLDAAGLHDHQIAHPAHHGLSTRFTATELAGLAVRLPVAVVGLALNWLPYRILFALSRRKDLDKRSTWSILAGLFLFPLYWGLTSLLAGILGTAIWGSLIGSLAGASVLIAGPVSGIVTLPVLDAMSDAKTRARAFAHAWFDSGRHAGLAEKRGVVLSKLQDLVVKYRAHEARNDR